MDALKWLLKASLILAIMFLGLKTDPNKENADNESNGKSAIMSMLAK